MPGAAIVHQKEGTLSGWIDGLLADPEAQEMEGLKGRCSR